MEKDFLIQQARRGNSDAFTQLMQQNMQAMYKTGYALLQKDEDVADAISETILMCWEKLSQLREDRYFKTWMTRILINKCKDILRYRQTLDQSEAIPEIAYQEEAFQNVEWKETINGIGERYRAVVLLYYVDHYKTSEIAKILDLPEATVRTRLKRARNELQKIYGNHEMRQVFL